MLLEFDRYAPRAQCVLGFLAAVAIFERGVLKFLGETAEPTLTFPLFLHRASESSTGFKSRKGGGEVKFLDTYFVPPDDPKHTGFNDRNVTAVIPLVARFMSELLAGDYFRTDSPLTRALALKDEGAAYARVADRIRRLADATVFERALDAINPDESFRLFLNRVFDGAERGLAHPEFPSLGIFDLRALKAENHGLDLRGDPNAGLFAVVREPRGWASQNEQDINLLVRDVLWIAPHDPKARTRHDCRGYYASSIDGAAFVVDQIQKDEDAIVVLGSLVREGKRDQRTRLVFSEFRYRHGLQATHGVVAGTTGEIAHSFFAAWKALVVRPDWPDLPKLEALLFQCDPSDAKVAFSILADTRAACVLFSKELRVSKPDVHQRREAFRSLIASDRGLMSPQHEALGDLLSQDLVQRLAAAVAQPAKADPAAAIESVMRALAAYASERWHLIEPAQIIVFKTAEHTREMRQVPVAARQFLQLLLEREETEPPRCPGRVERGA